MMDIDLDNWVPIVSSSGSWNGFYLFGPVLYFSPVYCHFLLSTLTAVAGGQVWVGLSVAFLYVFQLGSLDLTQKCSNNMSPGNPFILGSKGQCHESHKTLLAWVFALLW